MTSCFTNVFTSKRKRRHVSESNDDNDTAGEETPDTDDYDDQDDGFGRARVRPAPKGRKAQQVRLQHSDKVAANVTDGLYVHWAKQENQRKRRRQARAGSKDSDSSDLTELED